MKSQACLMHSGKKSCVRQIGGKKVSILSQDLLFRRHRYFVFLVGSVGNLYSKADEQIWAQGRGGCIFNSAGRGQDANRVYFWIKLKKIVHGHFRTRKKIK